MPKSPDRPTKKTSKPTLTEQLRELPSDALVELIERHIKTVPALKQDVMRLVGNDKTMIAEIRRAIKKLAAVRPNTRSRPKEIRAQLDAVLELIKHVGIRKPNQALEFICSFLDEASNVVASFTPASVVATFFRATLPALGADVIARCAEEDVDLHLRGLYVSDPFGTKAMFLRATGDVLSERTVAMLRADLNSRIKPRSKDIWMDVNRAPVGLLKALEVAVGNVEGYEKAARIEGHLAGEDALVLAQMCIDHEAYDNANAWLDAINPTWDSAAMRALCRKRDELYVQIAQSTGTTSQVLSRFRARLLTQPTKDLLDHIQALIGTHETETLLHEVATSVANDPNPAPNVMLFLVVTGYEKIMAQRMLLPFNQESGSIEDLSELAREFVEHQHILAAAIALRRLITVVLSTGQTPYYGIAIAALLSERTLVNAISSKGTTIPSSASFERDLRRRFSSKVAFWRDLDFSKRYYY